MIAVSFCPSPHATCRLTAAATKSGHGDGNHAFEAQFIRREAELSDKSAGFTSPHPNFGCVVASPGGNLVGDGYLYAQGTKPAEVRAVEAAGLDLCMGATAYLNMEPCGCHGDHSAVSALVQAGIARAVVGMRHPLRHLRGNAIQALRSQGVHVDVFGEVEDAQKSCCLVNAPLIYRAAYGVPFSFLKYAMTLDGKIAASSGHAMWISSKLSRTRVFELRGRSDAVIAGGSTVRRDNPRLTVRHGGKHMPMRIVMSQTLDLPQDAYLSLGCLRTAYNGSDPDETSAIDPAIEPREPNIIFFDKAWDSYVAFSNFSPHPIKMPDENGDFTTWSSVEHFYQAQKFSGVDDPRAHKFAEEVRSAKSPEEAARLGRLAQRRHPDLVRPDWETKKIDVMYQALKCKFLMYPHLNSMLLSTAGSVLVKASPHNLFWGGGGEGEGLNYHGRLLMQLRFEFLGECSNSSVSQRIILITSNKYDKVHCYKVFVRIN